MNNFIIKSSKFKNFILELSKLNNINLEAIKKANLKLALKFKKIKSFEIIIKSLNITNSDSKFGKTLKRSSLQTEYLKEIFSILKFPNITF